MSPEGIQLFRDIAETLNRFGQGDSFMIAWESDDRTKRFREPCPAIIREGWALHTDWKTQDGWTVSHAQTGRAIRKGMDYAEASALWEALYRQPASATELPPPVGIKSIKITYSWKTYLDAVCSFKNWDLKLRPKSGPVFIPGDAK